MRWISRDFSPDFDEVVIVPFADLHLGSPEFDAKKFAQYRDWVLDAPNRFCVILGDVTEMVTRVSKGSPNEQSVTSKEQQKQAVKLLAPLGKAKRIIAALDGNHERRVDETSIVENIVSHQDVGCADAYCADGFYLKLRVGRRDGDKQKPFVYNIYGTHGWGGGRSQGLVANKLLELRQQRFAHAYLSAHDHKPLVFALEYGLPDNRNDCEKRVLQVFMSAGTFKDWGGYSERGGHRLPTIGTPLLHLSGREERPWGTVNEPLK
ncbi:MAG: hypothetical protein AB1760_00365 [Pseudomonadota bacterium]